MAGFMAGFGTTLSNSIEEDRKHYREAAAKRRDYIQTYGTRAVLQREDQANQVMGTINSLKTAGIEEDDLRYVLDTSGVQGILQLSKTVAERDDLTAEERRQIVKKAKDYTAENPDEDINSIVKRAYGLYKSTDNPVKRERNLFSAMLGLDSRMMEDEVLDDMYVNGMSGRDIYRIMGSAGPKPGEAISLNLPAKPPSPTVLANTTKFLESQFNSSVDSRIKSIRTQMTKAGANSTEYTTLLDEQKQLEDYKSKGLLALGKYATIYDSTLFDFARAQEEALPGSISRNSYLYEFIPAFNTYFGEAADDAAVENSLNSTPKGEVPTIDPKSAAAGTKPEGGVVKSETNIEPEDDVVKFKTKEEFNEAAAAGEVTPGATVSIAGATPQPFNPPKGGLTSLLDGKDGNVAEYGAFYDALMSRPAAERSEFAKEYFRLDTVAPLAETLKDIAEVTGDAADTGLAYVIGGGQYALGAFTAGLGTAYNYLTGDSVTATKQRLRGERTKKEAMDLMAKGMVAYFERKAAEKEPMKRSAILDVPDDSMDAKSERGFGKTDYMNGLMSPNDSVSRTREAPAEEGGYKPTDMGATELNNPKVREKLTTAIKKSGVLDKAVDDLIGLAERVADSDRQFANDERNYPQPLPTLMSKPDTAEATEADALALRVADSDRQFANDERNYPQPLPTLMSKPDTAEAPEAETTVEDEPVRPKARPSRAPRVGQPEFMKLVQSLHGPSSDVVAAWKDKLSASDNKVTWNDVTRLIKQTKELRGSKLRSTLLESLYDYRDALRYKK